MAEYFRDNGKHAVTGSDLFDREEWRREEVAELAIIIYIYILLYIISYYIILYYNMSFQTGRVQYSVNSAIGLTEAYRDHAWYWGDFLWWSVKAGSRLPLLGCFVLKYVTVCDFQKKLLCRSSGIPNVRICKNSVDEWKILENAFSLHLFHSLLLSINGVRHVL